MKARKRTVRIIRVDEDGSLAKSHEFNMPLLANNIQLETTGGNGSKLNRTIERLNKEHHLKTIIGLVMKSLFYKRTGISPVTCYIHQVSYMASRYQFQTLLQVE